MTLIIVIHEQVGLRDPPGDGRRGGPGTGPGDTLSWNLAIVVAEEEEEGELVKQEIGSGKETEF